MSFKKVSLMLIVVIMSMFNIHNVYANARFADVPTSHGAYGEVNYLVDLGVIKGYTENGKTIFKPNAPVTRGQVAKMVVEATGSKPLVVQKSSFSDVQVGTELSGYVERAVELGYFSAYSQGKFGPNVPLTRDEMSRVLVSAFNLDAEEYGKLTVPFTDIKPTDAYYKYIAAIYYSGITKGDTTGTKYNATEVVKRSQFASFIARAKNEKYRLDLPVKGVTIPNVTDAIGQVRATTDNLNIRSSANSANASNILGKVNTGATFHLYEIGADGWLKIAYEGRYAYISKDYAQLVAADGQALDKVIKEVKALGDINLYKARDVSSQAMATITDDATIKVYGTTGNWYLTEKNGIPGYVRISQTKEIAVEPPANNDDETEAPNDSSEEETPPVVGTPDPEPEEPTTPEEPSVEEPETIIPPTLNTTTIGSATVDGLHIRASASGSAASLGKINRGTLVEVHSISGNWANITYNGTTGYVHKTYLRFINQTGSKIAGRIIVIDPGHGGKDPGTTHGKTIQEKEITLKVSNLVKAKLEASGAVVKMTRVGDTYPSLQDRVDFAKNNYAEMFVSIHVNSASSSAKGTETYYSVSSNDNEKEDFALATAINSQIVKQAKMNNRGVKRVDYYVIKGLVLPAVLVELGFISNEEDRSKLTDEKYIEIFAQAIYDGIVEYYSR
ncbi:N-acetylmuramoyl-L-alanine amidase [Metasolibacillus fluoroglycofenilyticus]|uniref:N-acetylmuramoyl-L-alanine amidase n=1 Tax=Metasolibacillus fluoroglycofenilyticus TaxID=1239396 RepID=UPI000D3D9D51|nr:N-acetylmuramoyl-L-alanine amidase [Metasolibacillus fluoroglycofenilyticus]